MITTADIHKGLTIIYRDEPHIITSYTFVNPGKGSAFARTKLKNLKTGKVINFTFKSGEKLEEAPVEVKELQYLYNDGRDYYFMDQRSFEQMNLDQDMIGDFRKFIKEGEVYQLYTMEGKAVALRTPSKIRLKVTEAEEGAKGNTVSGPTKTVTIETGYKVTVPLFIKTGDIIAINPDNGEYVSREGK